VAYIEFVFLYNQRLQGIAVKTMSPSNDHVKRGFAMMVHHSDLLRYEVAKLMGSAAEASSVVEAKLLRDCSVSGRSPPEGSLRFSNYSSNTSGAPTHSPFFRNNSVKYANAPPHSLPCTLHTLDRQPQPRASAPTSSARNSVDVYACATHCWRLNPRHFHRRLPS